MTAPDGTTSVETWYEAMSLPGSLRIDIDPLEKGNGVLFTGGKVHSFRDGKLAGGRPLVHPLMVLGFDVYGQPVATTPKVASHVWTAGVSTRCRPAM